MRQITTGATANILTLHLIGRWVDKAIIINGGSIFSDCQRHKGEERIENNIFNSKPNRQCTSCALLVSTIAYQRGICLRSYFVVWVQTKEQESEEGAKPEIHQSEYLNFWGEQRMKLGALFHFQFDPDRNQIR
jgi:hypothetical protein